MTPRSAHVGTVTMEIPVEIAEVVRDVIRNYVLSGRKRRVIADYQRGLAVEMIGKRHGITPQGVCMIVKRSGVKQRRKRRVIHGRSPDALLTAGITAAAPLAHPNLMDQ